MSENFPNKPDNNKKAPEIPDGLALHDERLVLPGEPEKEAGNELAEYTSDHLQAWANELQETVQTLERAKIEVAHELLRAPWYKAEAPIRKRLKNVEANLERTNKLIRLVKEELRRRSQGK